MDVTDKFIDPTDRIEAVWCKNAETGEEVLIDRITNRIIAKKDKDGKIV